MYSPLFLSLKSFRQIMSGSTGQVFTKLSPCGRYLVADYQSDPLFDGSRDISMTTNFTVIISNIELLSLFVDLTFLNGLQYHHSNYKMFM